MFIDWRNVERPVTKGEWTARSLVSAEVLEWGGNEGCCNRSDWSGGK